MMQSSRTKAVGQTLLLLALILIACMAVWLIKLQEPKYVTSLPPLPLPDRESNNPDPPRKRPVVNDADSALFVREILPAATDFVRRVKLSGLKMPFDGEITPGRLTALQFGKRIHIFVVDGHSVFHFHDIDRRVGIHAFNRAGSAPDGSPWNIDTLKTFPQRYHAAITSLMDTTAYPALSDETVQSAAKALLSNNRPGVAYRPPMFIQEAINFGTDELPHKLIPLPFYSFVFEKSAPSSTDPASVLTDSVTICIKSTADGMVLQHYEDLGIAFLK